jgi:hypothetical protein
MAMTSMPISFDTPPDGYRPGTCNIGPAEIARRRQAGIAGLVATVALGGVLLALDAPSAARWLVAVPLAGAAVGFLQARFRFCAGYGLSGVRNFGALGSVERVEDVAARSADRRKAAGIALASAVIGVAGALAFVLLPV